MTRPSPIEILPLLGHSPPRDVLSLLADRLSAAFDRPVTIAPPLSLPAAAALDRDAFSSNAIVDSLASRPSPSPDSASPWVLAVTDRRLVAPGRSFVFGEAALGGRWAVVTSAGLDPDPELPGAMPERLVKEAVHELGHLAGLGHCTRTACVMHPSTSVADIDCKESDFCEECRTRMLDPTGS